MNNKTKNITLLIAIALTVLSFQVKAQAPLYGCTDPNSPNYYADPSAIDDGSCLYFDSDIIRGNGWSTSAVLQINTPSLSLFAFDQVVVKFRAIGSATWEQLNIDVDPVVSPATMGGFADSTELSMWVFPNFKENSAGALYIAGAKQWINVRLLNLQPNTNYEFSMSLGGVSAMNGNTSTQELSSFFSTEGSEEAPFPNWPLLFQ